ncbi:MAG: hypothetical protein LUM44_12875 [Pyrinomonadaceae bacterium]|nr:hypothetical protein [Pyrinomonadaceae bacterium]
MNRRPNSSYRLGNGRRVESGYRRPFWLPASNYYILAASATIAFFFLIWGILHEGNEETPWIGAGIGASFVLGGAVFLREVVLRKARIRFLMEQRQLDLNIDKIPHNHSLPRNNKITIEQNSAIIKEIKKKSEAANVLGNLSEGHYEVFEMCQEYLLMNSRELQNVGVGSPRLAALRRGKEIVAGLHRVHLLKWAEIEAKSLTRDAKNHVSVADKIETAQKALTIIDSALQFYPQELNLQESETALKDFIASIKVTHWIEQAERSAFKGNYKRAISHYRDALFFLGRENVKNEEKDLIAEHINEEIEKIRELEKLKKGRKKISNNSPDLKEDYD